MAAGAPAAFCRTSRRGFASPQSARSSLSVELTLGTKVLSLVLHLRELHGDRSSLPSPQNFIRIFTSVSTKYSSHTPAPPFHHRWICIADNIPECRSWCSIFRCRGNGYRKKLPKDFFAAGKAQHAIYNITVKCVFISAEIPHDFFHPRMNPTNSASILKGFPRNDSAGFPSSASILCNSPLQLTSGSSCGYSFQSFQHTLQWIWAAAHATPMQWQCFTPSLFRLNMKALSARATQLQ